MSATPKWHVAQANVSVLIEPLDSELLAPFVAALDPVNALADAAPGFVWRLQTEEGNATDIDTGNSSQIINLSVWESLAELRAFAYSGLHVEVMRGRRRWFHKPVGAALVLWWVPRGHIPTVEEALVRLHVLEEDGPSPAAFTLREAFLPDGQ